MIDDHEMFSIVRGILINPITTAPITPQTMVQVACEVIVFIAMLNVRI